jgi:hypothetical protein
MKYTFIAVAALLMLSCSGEEKKDEKKKEEPKKEQNVEEVQEDKKEIDYPKMDIQNEQLATYVFLEGLMGSELYPEGLVGKGQDILKRLCIDIEVNKPADLEALYNLTDKATMEFNELAMKFDESGSEFETNARELTAADFEFIATTYGFENADLEEMLREREW